MRDFEDSTLWRISAFERVRNETGTSGFMRLEGPTVLSSTLMADLWRLEQDPSEGDVLEVMAACLRHREPALLYLEHQELVWPVTLFPHEMLYHSPRPMVQASTQGLSPLKVLMVEPPGVRPPGDRMKERIGHVDHYYPLTPLLWAVALHGPRARLLGEIAGTAAYRALSNSERENLPLAGAMRSAAERLRRESASLREIASWPGLSVERASRLLNALYLASSLMTTRSHPAARSEPRTGGGLFGLRKPRR
jgi:hypothetical protein